MKSRNHPLVTTITTHVSAAVVAALVLGAPSPSEASDCPLSISSLSLVAKSAGGASTLYRLQMTSSDTAALRATIDLRIAGSRDTTPLAVDVKPEGTSPGHPASSWFKRGSADVTAASIGSVTSSNGGTENACAQRFVEASRTFGAGATIVGVYDDRLPVDRFSLDVVTPLDVETDASFISESDFSHKVYADYADLDAQGDVGVGITVGPGGALLDSWIAWTSSDALLNEAALKAARASTYRPPTLNGRPTIRQYIIIYTFRQDLQTTPFGTADQSACPMTLFGLSVVHRDAARDITWYSVKAWTDKPGVVSAGVTFQDATGEEGRIAWPRVDLKKSTSIQGLADSGTFDWNGAPIVAAWVGDFTNADGARTVCQPWKMNLIPVQAGSVETASAAAKGHIAQISIEKPLPASLSTEVWPTYPRAEMDAGVEGTTGVQVLVDGKGAAREAHVTQPSGNAHLDAAALAAAMRSTYAMTPSVDIYTVYYKFGPD